MDKKTFDFKEIINYFATIDDELKLNVDKKFLRPKFLFCWQKIPGEDNNKIIKYLDESFASPNWLKNASVINEGKVIRITDGNKSILISLNNENTIANLEMSNLKTIDFLVINENGCLNVFLKSKPSPFKIEILVQSLLSLNIPLINTFEIVDNVVDSIKKAHPPNSTIESNIISEFVKEAILKQNNESKFVWEALFRRIYEGEPVLVEIDDGENFYLTAEKLRSIIIDKIAERLNKSEEYIRKIFIKHEISSWVGIVLDFIRRMGVSTIDKGTLEAIISELAFKPPTPWIGNIELSSEEINSHIEGIERHLGLIKLYYNIHKINDVKLGIQKILDDISILILNKYRIMYSSTPTKPFNKFYSLIKNETDENINVRNFDKFKDDLSHINYDIEEINNIFNSLRNLTVKKISYDSFKELIDCVDSLFIISKLIYEDINLMKFLEDSRKSKNENERFENLKSILSYSLKLSKDIKIKNIFEKSLLLECSNIPILNAFGSRIYCRIHPMDEALCFDNILTFFMELESDLNKLKLECNIAVSISLNGVDKDEYKKFKHTIPTKKHFIFLDSHDIEQLLRNPEKIGKILEIKFSNSLNGIKSTGLPSLSNSVPIFEKKDLIKAWDNYNNHNFAEASSICIDIVENFLINYLSFFLKIIYHDNWIEESKIYSQKKKSIKKWTLGEIIITLSRNDFNDKFKDKAVESGFFKIGELKDNILDETEKGLANSINNIRTKYFAHKDPGSVDANQVHKLWIETQMLIESISKKVFFPIIIYVHKKEGDHVLAVDQYGKKIIINSKKSSQMKIGNLYYLIPKEKSLETSNFIKIENAKCIKYGIICYHCQEKELFLTDPFCVKCGKEIRIPVAMKEYIQDNAYLDFKKSEDIVHNVQTLENNDHRIFVKEQSNLLNILHISDIHINNISEALKYCTQLELDLREELGIDRLHYLIISGDIARFSTPDEYVAALDFINAIFQRFELDSSRTIIVPGNHDINWEYSENAYIFVPNRRISTSPPKNRHIPVGDEGALIRNEKLYQLRFNNFNTHFYNKVYGKQYPLEYSEQFILRLCPEDNILFLALNSCWEIDHHYQKRASINMDALSSAMGQLSGDNFKNWLKIVVFHHPVTGSEQMNSDFLELLNVKGFKICLHGHIHEAIERYHKYDNTRGIHVIGAGTFGAPSKEQITSIPLQYNLLIFNLDKGIITVESRKKEKPDGAWSADARWGDKNNPVPRYQIVLKHI